MTDQPKPLTGTTVVTLAVNLPGPLAASRLVEYGARVIKVEPPAGDPLGLMVPDWYGELAAGQEVVKLDLKDAADRARLDEILAEADLLLTSFRPSANERLGLPASAEKHGLAYVEIVGSASHPDHSGHDLTYQAAFGTVVPPAMPPLPIADLLGAERATSTCLAMLRARELGRPDRPGGARGRRPMGLRRNAIDRTGRDPQRHPAQLQHLPDQRRLGRRGSARAALRRAPGRTRRPRRPAGRDLQDPHQRRLGSVRQRTRHPAGRRPA